MNKYLTYTILSLFFIGYIGYFTSFKPLEKEVPITDHKLQGFKVTETGHAFKRLIWRFEGLWTEVYNDLGCGVKRRGLSGFYHPPCGYLHIGFGHKLTPKEVRTGKIWIGGKLVMLGRITEKQAFTLLKQDVKKIEERLTLISQYFSQNEFDAFASYIYNCGYTPKFMKNLEDMNIKGAIKEMNVIRAQGKVLRGLVERRKVERELARK